MRALEAYIDFCRQFVWELLVAVLIVTVGAAIVASGLGIRADMARLLPATAPSVAGLERLEKAYGGQIGRLTVVLQNSDPSKLTARADRLAARLAGVDGVDRVEARKPVEFFERRRLLYAELDDLRTVEQRLEERVRWEKKRANPLFVDLGSGEPPSVDIEDIASKYGVDGASPYFLGEQGRTLAIFIYPKFHASDLERSRLLVTEVRGVIEAELADYPELSYGLTGRYKKRIDLQQMLQHDLAVSTSLALLAIIFFLIFFLRSLRGTLIVLAPLVVGTVWTFAWAEVTFGSLNILTAFLGAVLLGLGVDYGIHLYSRFHELSRDRPVQRALVETFASTGRANLFAALTTMVALGSLVVSEFRAFLEFGVIALGGLLLVLVAYALLFPCTVFWAHRREVPLPVPASTQWPEQVVRRLFRTRQSGPPPGLARLENIARAGLILLVMAASVGLPQLNFVRDFSVVQSTSAPSWKLDQRVNELLGQSQTPAVVLTDSPAQTEQVAAELRRRAEQTPEGRTIDKVVTLRSFVPDRQERKVELLERLRDQLDEVPRRARSDALTEYIREIDGALAAAPVSPSELPTSVRKPFMRKDERASGVVLVFPAINLSNMNVVDDYTRVLRDLPGIDPPSGYDAISDAQLLDDIISMAERDAVWMLGITLVGLLLLSIAAFRRWQLVLLQVAILTLAMLVGLGFCGLFGADFNFMNVIILPIWIGLGVDASFHILLHLRDGHALRPHLSVTFAIGAAYLTSMIGFGTLLLAKHNGLFSLGKVAVFGLGSILAVNIFVQLALVVRRRLNHIVRNRGDTT